MKIAVMFLTYAPSPESLRVQYAHKTLRTFLQNVSVDPPDELCIHIADDGSYDGHTIDMINIARDFGLEPTMTNSHRGGYGSNYNLATQSLHEYCDIVLPLEDDWEVMRPLNLSPLVSAIAGSEGRIRSIRLGHLGFTQEFRGELIHSFDQKFLLLDPDSLEPHVFAGHPRLETVEYERSVGLWLENIAAGWVEVDITRRRAAREGVAWPLDLCIPGSQIAGAIFAHIGSDSLASIEPEGQK